ncbi:MAG TPA: hypothetical protein ENF77_04775, partial [Candidatus Acetothermia bacterium]|nr:hypothetical protein [Candidatus Acetothermia bacterium]
MFRLLRGSQETKRILKILFRNPLSLVGIFFVCVFFIIAAIAPCIVPYPGDISGGIRTKEKLKPPSLEHFFGTDD